MSDGVIGTRERVLVAMDEAASAEPLEILLQANDFDTRWVADAEALEHDLATFEPRAVLLAVDLPGAGGIELCRRLRPHVGIPFVLMGRRVHLSEALESGASDYVATPFDGAELVARVRARIRGYEPVTLPGRVLRVGEVTIDERAHTVWRGSQELNLTPLEFKLLQALARQPEQAFTREALLEAVWGYRHPGDTRLVNVHVQRLRAKVERDPARPIVVVTVRGVGYRAGTPTPDEASPSL